MAVDASGTLYVADSVGNTIRKITPQGLVSTWVGLPGVSGTNDGPGSNARFNAPDRLALDSSGNVYVTDSNGQTVRKITPAGVVTTLAGLGGSSGSQNGTGNAARFSGAEGIAVDSLGNVFVAEWNNQTIRKITPGGAVTTFAGLTGTAGSVDGTGTAARFRNPNGVAIDASGNIYVVEAGNNTLRKITPAGVVTTLAGAVGTTAAVIDGVGNSARFNNPASVTCDGFGNIYVGEYLGRVIRKVSPAGVVYTIAGLAGSSGSVDALGVDARFGTANGVCVDTGGNIYIADASNLTIRKGAPNSGPPVIITQPVSQLAPVGGNATFNSLAAGSPTLNYKWLFNGQYVPGATTASLSLGNLQFTNAGLYSVVVSNAYGVASASALLTVGVNLNAVQIGNALVFNWSGSYILQTATNVTGPYVDVPGAAGSFTNLISSEPRRFFRLRSLDANAVYPSGFTTNGMFLVRGSGVPGYNYVMEASTNLIYWLPIQTNTPPFALVDSNAWLYPVRFYRTRLYP